MSRADVTMREVLLADMYEHEKDLLQKEIDRLTAELSRYKQGVEVEGRIDDDGEIVSHEFWVKQDMFKELVGQHVRVLVMKEGGDA